jgi:hypothetical protein
MDLVDHPQDTVYFHFMLSRKRAKVAIPGEQDTTRMTLRKREGEAIVNGKPWKFPDDSLRPQNSFSGKVYDFQAASYERFFLGGGEPEKLILKKGVGNQELAGKPQESVEQGHLPQIDQAAAVTNDDPHS